MFSYFTISPLIIFLSTSILLTILYKSKIRYTNFILDNLSVISWSFFYFLWQISTTEKNALLFCQLLTISSVFMPYFFTKFILTYLNKNNSFGSLKIFNNISATIFVILSFTPLMISGIRPIMNFKYWPIAGSAYPIFLVYFIGNFIFSYYLIFKESKKTSTNNMNINFIVISTFIGLIGGSTNFPLWFGIKIPPYGNIFLSIYMIVFAYAILKHELMDISLVITRTLAYAISTTIFASSIFLTYILLAPYQTLEIFGVLMVSALWAFFYLPFTEFLITSAKRKFVKGFYEPEKIIQQLTDKLELEENKEEILKTITDTLDDSLEIELSKYILEGELMELCCGNPHIQTYSELPTEIQEKLTELGFKKKSIIIPLLSPEKLEGIILLGTKSSGKSYDKTDINLIKQLRTYGMALLYKLTPYEKIEAKFLETQKKLYDSDRSLARAERIASLANLIQEYNHEIKTPLAVLAGIIDQSELPEDTKKKAFAQTSRIGDIVRTTLKLSSSKEHNSEKTDINRIIANTLNLLPMSGLSIKSNLAEIPTINGYPDDLQMLFTNLFQNANESMPNGGTLTITTTSNEENILIIIEDTGHGIPEDIQTKIFEPFFSTHVTKGRGLGLSVVFRIVREHQGKIEIDSVVSKGTTFQITIPLSA